MIVSLFVVKVNLIEGLKQKNEKKVSAEVFFSTSLFHKKQTNIGDESLPQEKKGSLFLK